MTYSITKRYWDTNPNFMKRKHTDIRTPIDTETARTLAKAAGKDLRCANGSVVYSGEENGMKVTVYLFKN